jgi:integrase
MQKRPPAFVPYIYSRDELRRILEAFDDVCPSGCLLEPATARAIVLTLYGAGLRRQEALNLDKTDVNWSDSLLTIRDTKFRKTRLVPFGSHLGQALRAYSRTRLQTAEGPFFTSPKGGRIAPHNLQRSSALPASGRMYAGLTAVASTPACMTCGIMPTAGLCRVEPGFPRKAAACGLVESA